MLLVVSFLVELHLSILLLVDCCGICNWALVCTHGKRLECIAGRYTCNIGIRSYLLLSKVQARLLPSLNLLLHPMHVSPMTPRAHHADVRERSVARIQIKEGLEQKDGTALPFTWLVLTFTAPWSWSVDLTLTMALALFLCPCDSIFFGDSFW